MLILDGRTGEEDEKYAPIADMLDEELLDAWTSDGDRKALEVLEHDIMSLPRTVLSDGIVLAEAWRGDFWHPEDLPFPAPGDYIGKGRCLSWSSTPRVAHYFAEYWLDDYYALLNEYERDLEEREEEYIEKVYEPDPFDEKMVLAGRPYVMHVEADSFVDLSEVSDYPNERELLSLPYAEWKIMGVDIRDIVVLIEVVPV